MFFLNIRICNFMLGTNHTRKTWLLEAWLNTQLDPLHLFSIGHRDNTRVCSYIYCLELLGSLYSTTSAL